MAGDNREFIEEFLVESTENLDQLDRDLLALEAEPDDPARLASIFRTVHTIKGNSGFFGFSKLGALSHGGEHLLGRLRDGTLTLDDRVSGTLYSMVDAVRTILRSIESTGTEGDEDFRDLSQRLAVVAACAEAGVRPLPAAGRPAPVVAKEEKAAAVPAAQSAAVAAAHSTVVPAGVVPVADARADGADVPAPPRPTSPVRSGVAAGGGSVTEASVRVHVDLLASMLDLVGELVLARNELRSIEIDDPALQAVSQRIHTVTNALQETAVKTRLLPVEQVFNRFPRTVRDLAVACGKEVTLTIDGADTELDRSLIEAIRDPLTHLIRNAVDHGIEPPGDRVAAGKPRAGRLALRAFNESGRVTIEVRDDGRGIDVERVRARAVSRSLVSAAEAALLPDERVLLFIFEPGFSTAATVTSVSGRGVGMDVVRTNIEALGGTVEIQSIPGVGTTIRVHVPLTLAIMPALVVHCAGERFAIPQAAVRELLPVRGVDGEGRGVSSPAGSRGRHGIPDGDRIEGLADAPVMRVRGRLVPLVFLDTFLGLRSETACRSRGTVVLVRLDDRDFGIVVDGARGGGTGRCRDLLEAATLTTIVVKPIGSLLSAIGLYAGATVLGDGSVVLILDPRGIRQAAGLPDVADAETVAASPEDDPQDRYLVCHTRGGRRIALPLDAVVRLEQHPAAAVQLAGGHRVLRRNDGFTPLVDPDTQGGDTQSESGADVALRVVLLGERYGGSGIPVASILDVASAETSPQPHLGGRDAAGLVSLGGQATEILDLAGLVTSIARPAG